MNVSATEAARRWLSPVGLVDALRFALMLWRAGVTWRDLHVMLHGRDLAQALDALIAQHVELIQATWIRENVDPEDRVRGARNVLRAATTMPQPPP